MEWSLLWVDTDSATKEGVGPVRVNRSATAVDSLDGSVPQVGELCLCSPPMTDNRGRRSELQVVRPTELRGRQEYLERHNSSLLIVMTRRLNLPSYPWMACTWTKQLWPSEYQFTLFKFRIEDGLMGQGLTKTNGRGIRYV